MQIRFEKRNILEKLCSVIIAAYVVTAMAFECTPNTSRYSTLGIYAVFLVGVLYIVTTRSMRIGMYAFSQYFMYFYVLLMSFAAGASPSVGQETAYYCLTCAIVCYIVYYVTYCYPKLVYLLIVGIIIGALILAYRISEAYGGIEMMLEYASREGGERRIGGMLLNENLFGLYMANATLCCILLLVTLSKHKKFYLLVVLCMIVFVAMGLMSGSKKAIIFMVVGICVLLWLFSQRSTLSKRIQLYFAIIITLLLIVQAIRTLPIFSTINARLDEFINTLAGNNGAAETDHNRMTMIKIGLAAFADSPLFGNGTGHSYTLFGTYSHSNYVELLMNYGAVGFCVYYVPYVYLVFALYGLSRRGDKMAAYLLVYAVLQLSLGVAWVNYYERVVQVIGAAAWGYVEHSRKKENGLDAV